MTDDERVAAALAAATQAARTRDDILATVSHDLRGPLHSITLAVEALRDEVPPEARRYLGSIERATQRAEKLIADLLEANTIENGALVLERGTIDAGAVLRQAAADHELIAREANATVKTVLPPEPIQVDADRDRVLQVLSNLLGNCFRHAKGTPVTLELERRNEEAVFRVRDCGPGIPPAELPHVFDRYWSGRTKRGGTGLGLAIAKGIVTAHGGTISAGASPTPPGAEFVFTLPLAHRSAATGS